MDDHLKIATLLASAGLLLEDAATRLADATIGAAASIKLLRDTAHDIEIIANAADVIERYGRLKAGVDGVSDREGKSD